MAKRIENVNIEILKQCRKQIGLDLSDVERKVKKIADIEDGRLKPTFNQLDVLARLYGVPRWVFIADKLPDEYRFEKSIPAFRKFVHDDEPIFSYSKIRNLVAKIERYRDLIIELREDMGEPVEPFRAPEIRTGVSPMGAAKNIREWLGVKECHDFLGWKAILEDKGIFVFLTSKYKGWSNIDVKAFRGLAIYNQILPVIVINDSDAKKAQSFSLFHELGHLLKEQTDIDVWGHQNKTIEQWCDEFSGNVLMPKNELLNSAKNIVDLETVKSTAKVFKVSTYACLVRLKQERIISQKQYIEFEQQLQEEYEQIRRRLEESKGGPARDRAKEIFDQFGHIYTRTVFQSYHNKEITLHKMLHLFNLKRSSYVFEMERML
jgi:Zn-dependent peptidase ImmA (M78 family)